MKSLLKILMFILIAFPAWAKIVQHDSPYYIVDVPKLESGEIHSFVAVVPASGLSEKYPALRDLDTLKLANRGNTLLAIKKISYVVNKPVGFFTDQQLNDQKWLEHLHPQEKLKRLDETSFQAVTSKGKYQLEVFFDSDDLSNVQRSKLIHAVALTKKLDPLSGGSFATSCMLKTKPKSETINDVMITNYISLTTKTTAVITYQITALKKTKEDVVLKKVRESFIKEAPALVQRTNSFKN